MLCKKWLCHCFLLRGTHAKVQIGCVIIFFQIFLLSNPQTSQLAYEHFTTLFDKNFLASHKHSHMLHELSHLLHAFLQSHQVCSTVNSEHAHYSEVTKCNLNYCKGMHEHYYQRFTTFLCTRKSDAWFFKIAKKS